MGDCGVLKRVSFERVGMDYRLLVYPVKKLKIANNATALTVPLFFDGSRFFKKISNEQLEQIGLYLISQSIQLKVFYVAVDETGQLPSAKSLFDKIYRLLVSYDESLAIEFYKKGLEMAYFATPAELEQDYRRAFDTYAKKGFDYRLFIKDQRIGVNAQNQVVMGNQFWRYYIENGLKVAYSADDYDNAHLWLFGLRYLNDNRNNVVFHPKFADCVKGILQDMGEMNADQLSYRLDMVNVIAPKRLAGVIIDNQFILGLVETKVSKKITPQEALRALKEQLYNEMATALYDDNVLIQLMDNAVKMTVKTKDNDTFIPSPFVLLAFATLLYCDMSLEDKPKHLFSIDVDNPTIKYVLGHLLTNMNAKNGQVNTLDVIDMRVGVGAEFNRLSLPNREIKAQLSNSYPKHHYNFSIINQSHSNTPSNAFGNQVKRWFDGDIIDISYPVHIKILACLNKRSNQGRSVFCYPVEMKHKVGNLDKSDDFYHYVFANYEDVRLFDISDHLLDLELGKMPYRILLVGDKRPNENVLDKPTVVGLFNQNVIDILHNHYQLLEAMKGLQAGFIGRLMTTNNEMNDVLQAGVFKIMDFDGELDDDEQDDDNQAVKQEDEQVTTSQTQDDKEQASDTNASEGTPAPADVTQSNDSQDDITTDTENTQMTEDNTDVGNDSDIPVSKDYDAKAYEQLDNDSPF